MVFDSNTYGDGGPADTPTDFANRRKMPRYPVVAEAQVTDLSTGSKFNVRISELSAGGCYVDILNAIPDGSLVRVSVVRDKGNFEAEGKVVYNHPGMGLGVCFIAVEPHDRETLNAWITELAGGA